jgi:hypothetical protein
VRQDNCVVWVQDFASAQQLLRAQLSSDWPTLLDGIAGELNPIHDRMFARFHAQNYWSVYQSEWAIDVVFRDASFLRRLYPKLVHHAMATFSSTDVLRFLGRRIPLSGTVPGNFSGQLMGDLKQRPEGVRIKHGVNGNTVKAYDKAFTPNGSVLRFETTVHNGDDFRVYRPKEGEPDGERQWRPLRRGIADFHRRAEISEHAAERYMSAFSHVDDSTTIEELTRQLESPITWAGRRVRGLRVLDPADRGLLAAINRGEFTLNGLRNRHLQKLLYPDPAASPREARRRSALVSRKLRLLRAHRLLQKVPKTHRYQVTAAGRKIIIAILTAMSATVGQLTKLAA